MRAKKHFWIVGLLLLLFAIGYWGRRESASQSRPPSTPGRQDDLRIVSLAPSITEILFTLGRGAQIVGVTRYCNYPPEAKGKPNIGGYFDLNYEALVDLEPTLIIMLEEHVKAKEYFEGTGYEVLVVNHATLEEIIESIELVGRACGAERTARELSNSIKDQMARVLAPVEKRAPKRAMIAVDRSKPRSLEQIYIAGNDGFFNKMIELAGGINVYEGNIAFPAISAEGILQMNPEVIIELVPETRLQNNSVEELISDWESLAGVDAVEEDRVFLLTNDYASIPGPRFVKTLGDIVDLLHSEES